MTYDEANQARMKHLVVIDNEKRLGRITMMLEDGQVVWEPFKWERESIPHSELKIAGMK